MKKSIIALSSGIIASLGLAFSIGMALYQAPAKTQALGTYSTDPSTYYSSSFVTSTHTGTALASDLHELMFDTHDTYVAYASLNTYLAESDQDPHDSDNIIGFWSNVSVVGEWNSSVWNKEHIWAQSYSNSAWTTSYGGADMHHIRPSDAMVNISRGNTAYGLCNQTTATQVEVNGVNTGSYSGPSLNTSTATVFEPRDSVKGDTARILLYMDGAVVDLRHLYGEHRELFPAVRLHRHGDGPAGVDVYERHGAHHGRMPTMPQKVCHIWAGRAISQPLQVWTRILWSIRSPAARWVGLEVLP